MDRHAVLDTTAIISWPISALSGGIITSGQISEVMRYSPERAEIIKSIGLNFQEPNEEFIRQVTTMARTTGDISGLSKTDLSLIALSKELNAVLVTDDYRMQNVAKNLGIECKPVIMEGIAEIWNWELVCKGCSKVFPAPKNTSEKRNDLGECYDCGSPLKLKRIM
tara:strand:+ start:14178 stop:14675 length:498 start_codon:yes stop_codon:yes gene_type:complete